MKFQNLFINNFNDNSIRENIAIATEQSWKITHWKNLYKVESNILKTNWVHQINPKKLYFKQDKLMKGSKIQRQQGLDIKAIISKLKHLVCYARILGIVNQREDTKADQEIRV